MFGGGLFNTVFTGQGKLAIICEGHPIIIPVAPNAPVLSTPTRCRLVDEPAVRASRSRRA